MDKLCLVGCLGSEPRLAEPLKRYCWRLGENAALLMGGGNRGRAPTYTLTIALQLSKITEKLSQSIRKVLG